MIANETKTTQDLEGNRAEICVTSPSETFAARSADTLLDEQPKERYYSLTVPLDPERRACGSGERFIIAPLLFHFSALPSSFRLHSSALSFVSSFRCTLPRVALSPSPLPTHLHPSLPLTHSLSLSLSAALSFSFHFYITTTFPHSSHDFLPANSSPSRSSLFLLWSRLISFSRSTSYIVSSILSLVLLVHFSPLFFYPPLPLTFPPLPTRSTLTYRRHSPSYAMPTTRPYRPFSFSTIYHYLVSLQFAFSASLFPDFLFPTSSTFPSSRRVCIDSRVKTFSIVE